MFRDKINLMVHSRAGFVEIGLALLLGGILAIMALTGSQSTSLNVKRRLVLVHRIEGFYAGEIVAISNVLRLQTTPLPDGRTVLTFDNSGG